MQRILDRCSEYMGPGQLELHVPDGRRYRLGRDGPSAAVRVNSLPRFLRALAMPDLRIGEAYMNGDWSPLDGELLPVLRAGLGLTQSPQLVWLSWLRHGAEPWQRWRARQAEHNSPRAARANVAHHYDLDRALYATFLDRELFYSCAYFRRPDLSLEAAQQAKCALIAAKLDLRRGQRVLDIGCGWGGLAIHLAREHGVHVTGITLSTEQLDHARQRVRDEGLAECIDLRLEDYRRTRGEFDAVVSVGMFEHVGRPQYATFFDRVRRLLRPDGVALVHTIGRSGPPSATHPWIARYIFPGGYIPAASEALAAIEPTGLIVSDLDIWRLHYALTLAEWHRRFRQQRDALQARFGERFCRMWEFYLQGSEASFRWGDLVVFQLQLLRAPSRLPITRDYLCGASGTA